jgi:hypothetical protein
VQLVPEILHVVPEGKLIVPEPPVWENVIVSPDTLPDAPDTVALHELDEPLTSIAVGEQLTDEVVAAGFTVSPIVSELAALLPSPG